MADNERAFSFLHMNNRQGKPRTRGMTEIRGPYYTPLGTRQLEDIFETMGAYIDTLKFAGGSFSLMPRKALISIIDLCHEYEVKVSTGGFIERVLMQGTESVDRYLKECRDLEFDIVEISSGFITVPSDDLVRLVEKTHKMGLTPKPEIGIQFGAGGGTAAGELAAEGTAHPARAIDLACRYLDAGAPMIMVESEGITENVRAWRTDAIAAITDAVGLEYLMFEAADPEVFGWYIRNYGPEVNLFVDHSQIVQLEALRCGIWGTKSLWGRVATYQPEAEQSMGAEVRFIHEKVPRAASA